MPSWQFKIIRRPLSIKKRSRISENLLGLNTALYKEQMKEQKHEYNNRHVIKIKSLIFQKKWNLIWAEKHFDNWQFLTHERTTTVNKMQCLRNNKVNPNTICVFMFWFVYLELKSRYSQGTCKYKNDVTNYI